MLQHLFLLSLLIHLTPLAASALPIEGGRNTTFVVQDRLFPRRPKNVRCVCFDRNLAVLDKWVIDEVPSCVIPGVEADEVVQGNGLDSIVSTETYQLPSVDSDPSDRNFFRIHFQCEHASPEICAKAEAGFEEAGAMISSAFHLVETIVVDARFRKMGDMKKGTLGSASTIRFHMMQDDDEVNRLYPQPLVKQLGLSSLEDLREGDIYAEFNADADFWFTGDPKPIDSNQHDFTYVVLHELFHGMGFASSWRDYFEMGFLTPLPQMVSESSTNSTSNSQTGTSADTLIRGFKQFIFDRFMVDVASGGRPLGVAAQKINTAVIEMSRSSPFSSIRALELNSFKANFSSTEGFKESQKIFTLASTPMSMAFMIPSRYSNFTTVIASMKASTADLASNLATDPRSASYFLPLETSIIPYRAGSSVSHSDGKTFKLDPDFLMRFSLQAGITLTETVAMHSNGNPFGPIGPKLLRAMAALGYTTRHAPGSSLIQMQIRAESVKSESDSIFHRGHWTMVGICTGILGQLI